MLSVGGLILGLVLLIGGGALLVRGASEIAAGFGISPMVVGLTIVGFGTSSPELVVNIIGALEGETALAFGNVVGSNISNLGLVLGAAALMSPIALTSDVIRRELPLLLLVTTMMTVMALDGLLEGTVPVISRSESILLMLMFLIFMYFVVSDLSRASKGDLLLAEISEHPGVLAPGASRGQWLAVIAGCALLFYGGDLTIRNGVEMATAFGVAPSVIGLFVVAVGTSMPELVTSIIAAVKKESDLALGNIIGSNIFNSLIVLPVSGAIMAITVPEGGIGDLVVSWLLAAVLIPIFWLGSACLGRLTGAAFVLSYIGYAFYRISGAAA